MPVLVPILALGVCVLALRSRLTGWRTAMLAGTVVWGVLLIGLTELLGWLPVLTAPALTATCLLVLVAGCVVAVSRRPELVGSPFGPQKWSGRTPGVFAAMVGALSGMVGVLGGDRALGSTEHLGFDDLPHGARCALDADVSAS